MVADYITKSVPRSLVRVPGSGRGLGATAPAVSCDLGRVSSLAASIIVNPYLPAIIAGPKVLVVPSTSRVATNKLGSTEVLASLPGSSVNSTRRQALNTEAGDGAGQESKRPRLDVSSPSTNGTSSSNSSPRVVRENVRSNQPWATVAGVVSGAGQEGRVSATTRRLAVARRTRSQQNYSSRSFEEALQEQNRLQEESRVLMQRLSYYLQLSQAREIQTLLPLASVV